MGRVPRVIQLPMSGRDRRYFVQQLRAGEQAHRALCARLKEAIAVAEAHRITAWALSCEEWNIRQFIGGPAAPSPFIADAISAGFELLDVRWKRCYRPAPRGLARSRQGKSGRSGGRNTGHGGGSGGGLRGQARLAGRANSTSRSPCRTAASSPRSRKPWHGSPRKSPNPNTA